MNATRSGQLMRAAFALLQDHPGGIQAKDLIAQLAQAVPLTNYEKSFYPNHPGTRRFDKIIRFASIAPVKAGWLVKSKGKWLLTEEGARALSDYPDPCAFYQHAIALYRQWKSAQPEPVDIEAEDADGGAATTLEEAEELAWQEIQHFLQSINPYELQNLVAALLKAMGYHVSWVAPRGPDKGVDIIAHTDPLGAREPRIKVQVKRQAAAVAVDGLRAFMAVLGQHDLGIFVAVGGFTAQAEAEARQQENRKITLIDAERLFDLWVEHHAKLDETEKRLLPLKPVYYLAAGA